MYTSVVDIFGSSRKAIGAVIAEVHKYSSSIDGGENPLQASVMGWREPD